jgi:hypothetical protein
MTVSKCNHIKHKQVTSPEAKEILDLFLAGLRADVRNVDCTG